MILANIIKLLLMVAALSVAIVLPFIVWLITGNVIFALVLILAPIGVYIVLKQPFLMAILFVVFSFFRIHEAFPFLMPIKIPLLLALATIASCSLAIVQRKIPVYWQSEFMLLILFFALCTIGMPMATNFSIAFAYWKTVYIKIFIMVFFIAYTMYKPLYMLVAIRFLIIAGVTISLVAIYNKLNSIGLVEGTRVTISRELGSSIGDPNDLSLRLLFSFSFALAFLFVKESKTIDKLLSVVGCILICLAIIYTQSRGGLLGIASALGSMLWFKVKNKMLLISLGSVAAVVLYVAAGISDRSSGGATEEGIDASAMGRIYAWHAAWNMTTSNPLTGVGLDNFLSNYYFYSPHWDGKNHAVHSTWFGVMAEIGVIGFFVFVFLVIKLGRLNYGMTDKLKYLKPKSYDEVTVKVMSFALLASVASFIVAGTFLTQGFTWPIYIITALSLALKQWLLKNKDTY
jgi:probable O-glycosylation ligase (exosortase A-associated)